MEEYLACGERFEVLGVVGVDGSPSCGVDYTCTADWYGSFDGRQGLDDTLASCQLVRRPGVFMRVLTEMLAERGWQGPGDRALAVCSGTGEMHGSFAGRLSKMYNILLYCLT